MGKRARCIYGRNIVGTLLGPMGLLIPSEQQNFLGLLSSRYKAELGELQDSNASGAI